MYALREAMAAFRRAPVLTGLSSGMVGLARMAPNSENAAEFIRGGASEFTVLREPFSSSRGPFESHGALFSVEDPVRGNFNAHMVAIANDTTGTVYFCIFEAPADNWDDAWRTGQTMMQKLVIDDSI